MTGKYLKLTSISLFFLPSWKQPHKVHIFCEGDKNLKKSPSWFGQVNWEILPKFCGLLKISKLKEDWNMKHLVESKVQLFWEGHINLRNRPYGLDKSWERLRNILWPFQKSWTLTTSLIFAKDQKGQEAWLIVAMFIGN
jgi:hypothetical protein